MLKSYPIIIIITLHNKINEQDFDRIVFYIKRSFDTKDCKYKLFITSEPVLIQGMPSVLKIKDTLTLEQKQELIKQWVDIENSSGVLLHEQPLEFEDFITFQIIKPFDGVSGLKSYKTMLKKLEELQTKINNSK
jgi:hypothetical protein